MKKYFYSVLAAGMLFATSCSQDELVDVTKGEGQKVTFKVELPGTESRAIAQGVEVGAGKYADKLIYAMYEEDKNDILVTDFVYDTDEDGKFEVTVPMAKDIKYDILFLAYNSTNSAFDIDNTNASNNNLKALPLKSELEANQEAYDAFIGSLDSQGVDAAATTTVPLYRPFAQVNAATTLADLEAVQTLGAEVATSAFTIYNAPNTLNVFDGSVSGEVELNYQKASVLTKYDATEYPKNETITVANAEYYYIAMAYVLAGKQPATYDADFKFYRSVDNKQVSSLSVDNMPVQANYRTNIVGTLLTKQEDYNIEIDANFGGNINTDEIVYTQEAFEQALAKGGTIYLGKKGARSTDDAYSWKNTGKSFKIVGISEGVVINFPGGAYSGSAIDAAFENVTLNFTNNNYSGFQHSASETYNNCIINNCAWTYAPNVTFEGCTFNQTGDNYNIWMYGPGNITVKDCDFNSYCKSILIYSESKVQYKVTIENSTFTSQVYDNKAAVQMHTESGIYGTLTMTGVTVSGAYSKFEKNLGWFNEINKSTGEESNNFQKNITIADGVAWTNDEYMISNDKGMFWFANEVNVKNNSFAGKIVKLAADIYMASQAWTPVGQTGSTQFMGTFDGNNKTIFNLSIDKTNETGANYSSGLFGWLNAATVKNVTVTDATVKGNHNVGVIAGYLETAGCTIENCHVSGATVECHVANDDANGDKAGIIVGHAGNDGVVVKDCTAKNSSVSAGRDAGQIVGAAKEANVTGCSATNVTVTANGQGTGANVRNEVIGRIL